MNIFKRFFGFETRAEKQAEITPEVSAELLRALVGSDEMNAEKALEIPAFSMAVDFISGTAAMLPVKLYRENTEAHTTKEITDDRRLFLLNDEANSIMGAAACRRALVRDMLIYGNGFIYIKQNTFGEAVSLHYVKKSDVSVQTNAHPIFKDFNIYVGGRGYPPFNFVILARNSPDGVTGIGAVEEHKTLLSAMYSTMKYEAVISKTGGNKKGFLQSEKNLAKPAMDELKLVWHDLYANNENNMVILNNGVKYVPSASTSVEMQLNENKQTNSEQIAQIFGLSPNVLSGNCSTAEYMSAVKTAVLPVVEQIQAALNQSLLTEEEKGSYYFVLDTTELLKGDTLSRYQAYEIALRNNFLQLDEVRYLEDKAPLGFDFMRLGLNDVLYDFKNKTVYTPNMNALAKLGDNHLTQEELRAIMEYRQKTNWIKGAHGYFSGSYPEGGGNLGLTNGGGSGIMKLGSDTVTAEKEQEYGVPYGVDAVHADMEYINSDNFAHKFDNITENEAVNRTLLECSRAAISHRNGTLYEDMYIINGNTGEILGEQINSSVEKGVVHNESIKNAINKAATENIPVIALHSHPEGYPPSVDDFNSALKFEYSLGVVVGHNGQVYKYEKPHKYVDCIDAVQSDIRFAFLNGVDIDRAYKEAFADYDLNYIVVKE